VPERVAERVFADGVRLKPTGRFSADQTNGTDPREVVIVAAYGTSTVPLGRGEVVVIRTWAMVTEQNRKHRTKQDDFMRIFSANDYVQRKMRSAFCFHAKNAKGQAGQLVSGRNVGSSVTATMPVGQDS